MMSWYRFLLFISQQQKLFQLSTAIIINPILQEVFDHRIVQDWWMGKIPPHLSNS